MANVGYDRSRQTKFGDAETNGLVRIVTEVSLAAVLGKSITKLSQARGGDRSTRTLNAREKDWMKVGDKRAG
jgi:hypothetical protein